jgi:hypothetical protein
MCGNIFNTPITKESDSLCNVGCPGKSDQTCGGFTGPTYHISVYATNYSKIISLIRW